MRRFVFVVGFVLATLTLCLSAARAQRSFTEGFTTTTYKDAINTTADWNTTGGELRLFPFVPTLVGTYDTPFHAYGVAVAGDLAFVADGFSGLQVIDISDTATPTLAGAYDTPGSARGVAVAGDLAFVADYDSGLQIVDISNPATPTPVGFCDTPGSAFGVAVAGDLAFVADGGTGFHVIDIIYGQRAHRHAGRVLRLPADSGYSVDNLAPSVPASFAVAYNTGSGNTLSWDESTDADFQYFHVYRSSDPNFTPGPGNLAHSTTSMGWVDPDNDGGTVYYKVTSTDFAGNESDAASPSTTTTVWNPTVPTSFALHQNVPNPFNPTTTIRYDVARGPAT